MDRETRRANLKKLANPATRKLRSNAATATMTLSEYFNTIDSPSGAEAAEAPQLQPEHLFAEPQCKKSRDMELAPPLTKPKPKKAPKLKTNTQQRRARGRSKQQPSISDFLRNEQLFAEVTAQHCMADNFSPDDIEMALALSKSEAQKYGRLRLNETDDEQEEVINLLDKEDEQSTRDIRRKLQKYGFRTAAKEDYNMLSIAASPFGKRGKRGKWANKFTPLTLRNPAEQLKKINYKVSALLAQQVRTKLPNGEQQPPFELTSALLRKLQASADCRITHEPSADSLTNLSAYYVEDLIEVSRTPADHLLKSWAAIQGRDVSPQRLSDAKRRRQQQLEQVYAELEAYFGNSADQKELDELEKLVADNMIEDNSQILDENVSEKPSQLPVDIVIVDNKDVPVDFMLSPTSGCSPLKEPPDKRARMTENKMEEQSNSDKENMLPSSSSKLSLPTQSTRCTSPDLFADSDDEPLSESSNTDNAAQPPMQNKDLSTSDINTYEVYSSDEVKTVSDPIAQEIGTKASPKSEFVDLTQDSPDFGLETTSRKSALEMDIFPHSPIIEFDEESEEFLKDSSAQSVDCEISEELYAKYAYKTAVHKADLELSSQDEQQLNSNSFNLSNNNCSQSNSKTSFHLATTPSLASKDSSLSFSHLDNPKIAFQRSFSLTQSPGQTADVNYSFKSPLSRRSNSFSERGASICTTPFGHSDASIDLTEDSDNDDVVDNEGVLLSDDEINYSIWKADKTCRDYQDDFLDSSSNECSLSSPLAKIKSVPHFKTVEDLDAYLDASPATSNKSSNSRSPNKSALSKERAEFGILDAAISQPFTLSQLEGPAKAETSQEHIDWTEASFLDTPPEAPLKRYSNSCTDKFKDLLRNVSEPGDELDDFDHMVFQNVKETSTAVDTFPSGLDRLLQGEITVDNLSQPVASAKSTSPAETTEQLELNGQVYDVRSCLSPKPDFVNFSEAALLQQLYKYGIKPLKRKQAVKLLEYIYNQTHPIMLPPEEKTTEPLPRSKSTPVMGKPHARLLHTTSNDCLTPTEAQPQSKLEFSDATGSQLLRFSQAVPPALCDDFECYVLQTNVSKKTPQPLLPLHIAWHNLLCANPSLHESVLMFVPIDLQEIYMYLKQLGHRYEPKDLKCFFDRRCIIFRYELAPPAKQAQRHVRKPKSKKPSSKY